MAKWSERYRRALSPERYWSAAELTGLASEVAALHITEGPRCQAFSDVAARSLLRATQPMASVLGATLHTLMGPAHFESDDRLWLLAAYADDVGVGAPEASRFSAFQRVMASNGLSEDATSRSQMCDLPDLDDELFIAPALILALSRRSDLFADELVGMDLHIRQAGLLAPWEWCRKNGLAGEWDRLDLGIAYGDGPTPLQRVSHVVDSGRLDAVRVRWGATLAELLLAQWESAVFAAVRRAVDPRLAMERLMRRRSREASVYHSKSRLAGRSIQEWFEHSRTDPASFVDALASSRYVRAGLPEQSRLLTVLADFGGPMFRVFSSEDREIISRWIVSLTESVEVGDSVGSPEAKTKSCSLVVPDVQQTHTARPPESIREAYSALQNRASTPAEQLFCSEYIDYWLSLAESSLGRHPFPLPEHRPQPGGLVSWLLDAHDEHARVIDLDASREHPPSREAIVESTVQLAPLTLIDGSWLLGYTDLTLAGGRIGYSLFETFYDELGNGDIAINHPRLYRQVLKGMDVELPPTASPAFAMSPLFRDESFELPVYWLAIGRFPDSRRPEILGLNLAMELSGVGGGYMVARQGLRAYGFPTVFVDIHNTIDNVSTGHAAWAAHAIESLLDAARSSGASHEVMDALWMRIRIGFASLDPVRDKRGFFGKTSTTKQLAKTFALRLSGPKWRTRPTISQS